MRRAKSSRNCCCRCRQGALLDRIKAFAVQTCLPNQPTKDLENKIEEMTITGKSVKMNVAFVTIKGVKYPLHDLRSLDRALIKATSHIQDCKKHDVTTAMPMLRVLTDRLEQMWNEEKKRIEAFRALGPATPKIINAEMNIAFHQQQMRDLKTKIHEVEAMKAVDQLFTLVQKQKEASICGAGRDQGV